MLQNSRHQIPRRAARQNRVVEHPPLRQQRRPAARRQNQQHRAQQANQRSRDLFRPDPLPPQPENQHRKQERREAKRLQENVRQIRAHGPDQVLRVDPSGHRIPRRISRMEGSETEQNQDARRKKQQSHHLVEASGLSWREKPESKKPHPTGGRKITEQNQYARIPAPATGITVSSTCPPKPRSGRPAGLRASAPQPVSPPVPDAHPVAARLPAVP